MTKLIKSIIRNIQLRVEDRENELELEYYAFCNYYSSTLDDLSIWYCELLRKGHLEMASDLGQAYYGQ
jgi:hypothetical protein